MGEVVNKRVAIESCYPHPDNYNYHSPEQIADLRTSLKTFGQVRSIVVQDDGQGAFMLVAGEGIWTAAKAEGYDELRADVIPPDWSAVRVKAYLAADNELAKGASPDEAQLAALVVDVGEVDETLARLAAGTDERLRELVASTNGSGPAEDPGPQIDKAAELQEKWQVETGDLWVIPSKTAGGEHRVVCGDCTDRDFIDQLFGTEFADMCFTDPPFGTMATGRGGKSIAGDQTYNAVLGCFDVLPIVLKPGSAIYVMGGTFNMPMMYKLFDVTFRQVPTVIVWDKEQFVMRHHDYHSQWEAIFYSWKPGGGGAEDRWFGDRKQPDVWRVPKDATTDRFHITQKPVALIEKAVKNSAPIGGSVWEPFVGSGSTLIACEQLGRLGRGVEIEPKYVAVTLERLAGMGLEPQRVSELTEAV